MINRIIMKPSASEERWKLAQSYEKAHWRKQVDRVRGGGPGIDWYQWKADQVVRIVEPFLKEAPRRILEIGSGPVGTISYLPWGERYAVEPLEEYYSSQPELIRFRDRAVKFLQGVGEKLPFDDGFLNLVICENVLDHTKSPSQVLQEVKRVLADDGLFFMSVNIHTEWGNFVRSMMENFHLDKGHPHSYSQEDMKRLLNDAGLEALYEETEAYREARRKKYSFSEFKG